jgi:hypothetical protein
VTDLYPAAAQGSRGDGAVVVEERVVMLVVLAV